jgi:FkbM family methyltransferase
MRLRFLYRNLKARFRDQRQEIRAILQAAAPGDTVVDVGANKGSYLWWMSRAVRHGRVVAFEPQARLADYLRTVVRACRLHNVTVEDKAVSDRSGRMVLHVPGESDSPGASLEQRVAQREPCRPVEVELVTLDEYFAGARSGRIAALKVDVEGHEFAVFRGAQRTIAEHRPLLVFESENRHLSEGTVADVLHYVTGLGYTGSVVCRNTLLPLAEFDPADHQRQEDGRFWDRRDYCNNFILWPSG